MEYGAVTEEIISALKRAVGDAFVRTDREKLEACSRDETETLLLEEPFLPDVAVAPSSPREVSEILKIANRYKIPVTPRGGGTGLSGGALAVYGGIVLTDDRLNRIVEIDDKNFVAVCEPGVITNDINAAAREKGLTYPGYPMSVMSCHVGGNIAENSGGGNAVKYGVTMRYVLGLEVVIPTGEILTLGGKSMKDVSGYSLKELFVSSEGTLGYITKIILRLLPIAKKQTALLALFSDTASAVNAASRMTIETGVLPSSIEYIDVYCYRAALDFLKEELPLSGVGAVLLTEIDGADEDALDREAENLGRSLKRNGAREIYVADDKTSRERVWAVRRSIDEALRVTNPIQADEDICVPASKISEAEEGIREISKKYNVPIVNFGHAGDGNMHPTILKPDGMPIDEWKKTVCDTEREIFRLASSLGGVISGEHGIGYKRRDFFTRMTPPENLALMRKIKAALDPNNIMNPGKIF